LFKILHISLGPITGGILLLAGILLEMITAILLLIKLLQTKDLKDFFDYNDQLDRARGTKLSDYIPELELARNYIN
jgi:hypothetical protein